MADFQVGLGLLGCIDGCAGRGIIAGYFDRGLVDGEGRGGAWTWTCASSYLLGAEKTGMWEYGDGNRDN